MSRKQQRNLARQAYADHASMSAHVGGFETFLAAPPAERTPAWRRALLAELRPLIARIHAHSEAAESDGGLLTEIEVTLGRSHEVSTARRLHRSAARQAEELAARLGAKDAAVDSEVRQRSRRLGSAIRRHHELEADLILMAFDQDIGAVD